MTWIFWYFQFDLDFPVDNMSDPKFLSFLERKKLGGKFDLPGEKLTTSVLSTLSPPRSSISSAERPVSMPRTWNQISTSTNNQNMQRSNLIVINVSAKQHKKAIWSCTNYWYIRGQNLIVIIVTTNSKNNQSLNNHKQLKHKGITYDCNQCEYKATTMGSLKVLKQSQHERFEYICVEFEYGAKQALNIYKQSKHEASFVDYKRDYKATTKVQLRVHKLSKHMGIKYNLI